MAGVFTRAGEEGVDPGDQIEGGCRVAVENTAEFLTPVLGGVAFGTSEEDGEFAETPTGCQQLAGAGQPGLEEGLGGGGHGVEPRSGDWIRKAGPC